MTFVDQWAALNCQMGLYCTQNKPQKKTIVLYLDLNFDLGFWLMFSLGFLLSFQRVLSCSQILQCIRQNRKIRRKYFETSRSNLCRDPSTPIYILSYCYFKKTTEFDPDIFWRFLNAGHIKLIARNLEIQHIKFCNTTHALKDNFKCKSLKVVAESLSKKPNQKY